MEDGNISTTLLSRLDSNRLAVSIPVETDNIAATLLPMLDAVLLEANIHVNNDDSSATSLPKIEAAGPVSLSIFPRLYRFP